MSRKNRRQRDDAAMLQPQSPLGALQQEVLDKYRSVVDDPQRLAARRQPESEVEIAPDNHNPDYHDEPTEAFKEEKQGTVVFVQLGRLGDILCILPAALKMHLDGWEVHWLACNEYDHAFAGQPWITVHPWENGPHDVSGAIKHASGFGFDKVICTQVNCNPVSCDPPMENFCGEMWQRSGMLEKFHSVPLLYDRDDLRDGATLARFDGIKKPIVLFNVSGISSPFPHVGPFYRYLFQQCERLGLHLFDLSTFRVEQIRDLLCLYEHAALLITIDTATLHLAWATPNLPVIALSRDVPWHMSEPHANWAERLTYPECVRPECQQRITDILQQAADRLPIPMGDLVRDTRKMRAPRIIHVAHCFDSQDINTDRRNALARTTWELVRREFRSRWQTFEHRMKEGDRTSADLGDDRPVPYVRDVIDLAASKADPDDIIVLTNADTCLIVDADGGSPEVCKRIMSAMKEAECCCCSRVEFQTMRLPLRAIHLRHRIPHPGTDLFVFTRRWWERNRDGFPDMLIGCERWDWILRLMILRDNPAGHVTPLVYHEMHRPFWTEKRWTNVGQIYNRKLCREWCEANGFAAKLYAEDPTYRKPEAVAV